MSPLRKTCVMGLCWIVGVLTNPGSGLGQSAPDAGAAAQELNGKIEVLTRSLQQTQTELARSRTEIEQLRAMLEEVLKRMEGGATLSTPPSANPEAGQPAA